MDNKKKFDELNNWQKKQAVLYVVRTILQILESALKNFYEGFFDVDENENVVGFHMKIKHH